MPVRIACLARKLVPASERGAGSLYYLADCPLPAKGYYLTTVENDAYVFASQEAAEFAFASFPRGYGKLVYQACYHEPVYIEALKVDIL